MDFVMSNNANSSWLFPRVVHLHIPLYNKIIIIHLIVNTFFLNSTMTKYWLEILISQQLSRPNGDHRKLNRL